MKYFNIYRIIILLLLPIILQSCLSVYGVEEVTDGTEITAKEKDSVISKIDFDSILQKAKEHSYDLKIADYNVLISKQGIRSAKSEYFPKLHFSAGTEYTKNFRNAKESTVMSIGDAFINPYTRYQSVLGITVGYNLFDFGVRGGNLKVAKEDAELKELENKEKLQELNLTLLDSYTKILILSKQIKINEEILKLEEKNLEYYERLYKAKEVSKTDLNNAKVKFNTTKNKITELKSMEQESLNWLSFYTGEEYSISSLQPSEIENKTFDVFEYNDYTKSIIWKIYEQDIKKKEAELYVAKRMNYPKLNVYGRYYLYGSHQNNYGRSFGNIEPSNFSVGASLNMPVFDGFKNRANIEKTVLELKQLLIERDKSIAHFMTKLANLRSNLNYINTQISENNEIMHELSDKENSAEKLLSKKVISPIEYNNAKIELLTQEIELEKNTITKTSLIRGIQILTEEM